MKLTKKLEEKIRKVYDAYWDAYLKGDMRVMSSLMDENCQVIGSGQGEFFNNKKETVKYYKTTADQIAGKAEMRNRKIGISPAGSEILISEECDFFVLMDSVWTFYGQGRISTLFAKSERKWKIIHQHGSLPDARTGGGEQINTDKIKEENIRLKDAVKRRTIELEHKNRELEIEASLERVRAVAMSMNKSEDLLSICEITFKEFQKLGFDNLRNAIIHILNDEKGFFLDYDYSDYLGGSTNKISYNSHPIVENYLKQIKKADDAFAEVVIEGDELDGWKEFRRKGGQLDDPRLDEISSLHYYLYSIGVGDIGISTFKPIDESQIKILKRFRNVFDLAYRRYNDIALAEAQTMEAKIEASLERVRARTMGMQKSEELKEVIQVVYEQFVHLNIFIEHAGFIMDYKTRDDMHIWLADKNEIPSEVTIPYFDSPHWNSFNEAKEKGLDFFANKLTFEEKNRFYKKLFKLIPGVPEETLDYYFSCPGLAGSTVLLENVGLYIENFSGIPYSDEENNTLMRFGKVFQQTYTRFNDLQKAEAQVREAQIETALEKVRSRTMGMHNSHDVGVTVVTLFDEVLKLGIDKSIRCGIGILEGTEQMETWSATSYSNGEVDLKMGMLDMTIHPMLIGLKKAWKSGETGYSYQYTGNDVIRYYNALNNEPEYPFHVELDTLPEKEFHNSFFFSEGILFAFTANPISEEAAKVLNRFASVFGQTYRRYLDLQKAEAQAREAQIEAALEKVRSRTMAMQRSEELSETSFVLFQQFAELGIAPNRFFIGIVNEEEGIFDLWITEWGGTMYSQSFKGSLEEPLMWKKVYEAWKAHHKSIVVDIHGEDLVKWNDYLKGIGFPVATRKLVSRIVNSCAIFSKGILSITTPEITETETVQLLERFASVFDGTYTRFIDLKKAEAQAREARIETALERVRSRTMAMYDSNELLEAVAVFFQQFKSLRLLPSEARTYFCHINTDNHTAEVWMTHTDGKVMQGSHITPLNKSPSMLKYYEAWKSKEPLNIRNYSGEALADYMQFLSTLPHVAKDEGYQHIFKDPPERIVMTDANFLQGNIGVMTFKPLSQEALDTLVRFAKVFELTYTRFLDLQKAEAQAREAKIEASLERVRARTMAMYKSDDLTSAVATVFEELRTLGLKTIRCGVGIFDGKNRKVNVWTSSSSEKSDSVQVSGDEMLEGHTLLDGIYDSWQRQQDYSYVLKGEDLTKYYNVVADSNLPVKAPEVSAANAIQYYHCAMFPAGGLFAFRESDFSAEAIGLMKRFADVFHLTFIRHLDLKNAESQNKIIQAENERKTQELEEARQLQLAMLPKELPKLPDLEIAVYMNTATEVGGDYYDFQVGKDGTLTVAIGDATGHGMKAGTMVTITKSLFDSLASGENILDTFNNISKVIKGMKFRLLSMCLMLLKIKGDQLFISSAAMPPALIYRRKKNKVEEIFMKGMPLGAINNFPYTLKESYLKKGDTILLMSDGLPELSNANNEMYGYDRTKTEFRSVGEKEPEEIVNHLKNSASQWVNGKEPDDDVTFVVIKIK